MHNKYAMPNTKQSSAERRLKYGICRMFELPWEQAQRLRDWNWHPIRGHLMQHCEKVGIDPEAAAALCQEGYDMFREEREAAGD